MAGVATEAKAEAQMQLALAVVATNKRLNERRPGMVSLEEMRKAEAEVQVASEMKNEAIEKRKLDAADLALAQQTLREHMIVPPFDGIIIERMKNPGESVRANEAVVRLGNLDQAPCAGPISRSSMPTGSRKGRSCCSSKSSVAAPREEGLPRQDYLRRPQIQPIAEVAVRIYAEFENPEHELRPGAKAVMNIQLGTEATAANSTVGASAPAGVGR